MFIELVIRVRHNANCFQAFNPDFPGGSVGKVSAYDVGDPGSNPGLGKISWRRKWQPTPVFLPGKSHGRKSLIGYSSWGRKESDTTEQLHFHFQPSHNPRRWYYLLHFSEKKLDIQKH